MLQVLTEINVPSIISLYSELTSVSVFVCVLLLFFFSLSYSSVQLFSCKPV